MRFLVDMPLSPRLADWLREQGHDAVYAHEVGPGRASDQEVLDRAVGEFRVVVTADTDFPHLLALSRERTPGVILIRGGDYATPETITLLQRALRTCSEEAITSSICAVDRRQVRCRRLPIG